MAMLRSRQPLTPPEDVFDTHIHLDVMTSAARDALPEGYQAIVPGITPDATRTWLAEREVPRGVQSAAAWHPWYLPPVSDDARRALRGLCARPDVAWVGETGLDYYRHKTGEERALARQWFVEHLRLAAELDMPVIVHCVRAHGECLELLTGSGTRGIIHAYSGSLETVRDYARRGYCVGIGAAVTRGRSKRVRAAAADAPEASLVLETDAPYMFTGEGEPREGVPSDIRDVYNEVAALRASSPQELVELVERNVARLLSGEGPRA